MEYQQKFWELFTYTTANDKNNKIRFKCKMTIIFAFYTIVINFFSIFYKDLFLSDKLQFTQTQLVVNYVYSLLCIVLTLIFLALKKILHASKIKSEKVKIQLETLIHFYFMIKINMDMTNLFYLTPTDFKYCNQLLILWNLLLPLSLILYFSSSLVKKTKQIIFTSCLVLLAGFSILISYLYFSNGKLIEVVYYEISKLSIYLFMFILNLGLNEHKCLEAEHQEMQEHLHKINNILLSTIENSKLAGLIILKDSEKVFNSNTYFENIVLELLNKRDASKMRSIKSLKKRSLKLSTLKISKNSELYNYNVFQEVQKNYKRSSFQKSDNSSSEKSNSRRISSSFKPYKHNNLHKPLSSINVLKSLGDFKMKLPIRRNLSTRSLGEIQIQNDYLDDIKEEKDENEISFNHRGTKKSNTKKISLDTLKAKSSVDGYLNHLTSEKSVYKTSKIESNMIREKSNKKLDTIKEKKKTSQPIFRKDSFIKALGDNVSIDKRREVNAIFDSVVNSSASSSYVPKKNKSEIHEIQHNVLDIFKENVEYNASNDILLSRKSESNKQNSVKLLQKLEEMDLNTINRKNFIKKSSKFLKHFKEEKDGHSSNESSLFKIVDKTPQRIERNSKFNPDTVKLIENLENMSDGKKMSGEEIPPKQKLLFRRSGNYLNIFKERNSSGTEENILDIKNIRKFNSNNQNTYKLLKKLEEISLAKNSGTDSQTSKQAYDKLITVSQERNGDGKIENNYLIENNYNIQVYGAGTDYANTNINTNQGLLNNNKGIFKNEKIPTQIQNPNSINQNINNDLYSSNFLQNLSLNNIIFNNLQILVSTSSYSSIQLLEAKYENLRNIISAFNKTIGNGMLLSVFLRNIQTVIDEDGTLNDELEFGNYHLNLVDMGPSKDLTGLFESNYSNKKLVTFTIAPLTAFNKKYYFITIKDFYTINFSNNQSNHKSTLKNIRGTISLNNWKNSSRRSKFPLVDVDYTSGGGGHGTSHNHQNISESNSINRPIPNYLFPKNSSLSLSGDQKVNAKFSALLHDFKHIIIDTQLYNEYIFSKYQVRINEDENLYIKVMNDYANSLILNITNFMKDPDNFFKGGAQDNSQQVDLIFIIETMVKIFNRRLEWENESNVSIGQPIRNLKIHSKINDRNNPNNRRINSNKNLLISLFYNILSNSFKATKEGEILIELSTLNDYELMVKIIDTGSGLPEKVLKNWFKPFNMDKSSPIKNENGTGLGQFIMAAIIKSLKYELPLPEKNPNGCGTIFKIVIPINPGHVKSISHTYDAQISLNTGSMVTKRRFVEQPYILNSEDKDNLSYSNDDETVLSQFNREAMLLAKEINSQPIKTYQILCFDDDPIIINSIVQRIKQNLSKYKSNIKFEFDICYNFENFYDKFSKSLAFKNHYHFFILDQNISLNIKGIEIADMIHKTYSAYFENTKVFYSFLFVTEQADSLKVYFERMCNTKVIEQRQRIFDSDNVFGKREYEQLGNRIIQLVTCDLYNY